MGMAEALCIFRELVDCKESFEAKYLYNTRGERESTRVSFYKLIKTAAKTSNPRIMNALIRIDFRSGRDPDGRYFFLVNKSKGPKYLEGIKTDSQGNKTVIRSPIITPLMEERIKSTEVKMREDGLSEEEISKNLKGVVEYWLDDEGEIPVKKESVEERFERLAKEGTSTEEKPGD